MTRLRLARISALVLVTLMWVVAESPEEDVAILDIDGQKLLPSPSVSEFGDDDVDLGEGKGDSKVVSKLKKIAATTKKPGRLRVRNSKAYSEIKNFVYKGIALNVKNMESCMNKCDDEKECRSFSYRKKDKKCFWSTGSLRYNPKWEFYSKEYDLNAFGKMVPTSRFHRFNGLMAIDEDRNMKTEAGRSLTECKNICNGDTKCLSFSWNERDHACLMGIQKVEYSRGWSYFERNKKPKNKGGKWLPYPLRPDAYHREQHREEMKTLRLFAERDKKLRMEKVKKKEMQAKKMTYMEKKRKRLDQEMKVKIYAREQRAKVVKARKKEQQEDMEAATEKGKFDEAFHKQTLKNKELLHKRKMELKTKNGVKEQKKKYDANEQKRFDARMAKLKARGMKEIGMKNDVVRGKERKIKEKRIRRAVDMKNEAFKLVLDERKYKSGLKNMKRVKKLKKKVNKSRQRMWKVADAKNNALAAEIETKRKIKMSKEERRVKLKLVKEKLGKKPPSNKIDKNSIKSKQPTLPRPPKTSKPKSLPKRAPGQKGGGLDAARKATSPKSK